MGEFFFSSLFLRIRLDTVLPRLITVGWRKKMQDLNLKCAMNKFTEIPKIPFNVGHGMN